MNKFTQLLSDKGFLVIDGAMGTQLFNAGLISGNSPEEWNVTNPELVQGVHQSYVDAGSDIILTNSFGGTRFRLKLHNFQDRAVEFNRAAAQCARAAADTADRPVLVAGSMGPTGELLVPMGEMTYEAAKEAFAEQAQGLAEGGADVLWIETMSDLDEVRAAYEGARSVSDLPICATMSFDTSSHTMMGVSGEQAVTTLAQLDLAAIGANCGNNLPETELVMAQMRAINKEIPLICKANAGIPEWRGEELYYDGSPEVMANHAHQMRDLGIQLIGGCCGSNPDHIRMMKQVLNGEIDVPDVQLSRPAPVPNANLDKERTGRTRTRRRRRQRD